VLQQVHMRMAAQVAVVGAGQRGGGGREDDVVAVPPEAGEAPIALRRLRGGQLQQPGALPAHLLRVGREAEASQPGAVVRRAHGHHAMHTLIGVVVAQPGAHGQPAHAVRHQQRRPAGGLCHALHGRFDQRRIVIDRTEHRFQIDGDAGNAGGLQPRPPGVPKAAVADEAVHQHQPAAVRSVGRQMVCETAPAPGLLPAEDAQRAQRLGSPGAQHLDGGGRRCRIAAVQAAQQQEFQRHQRHVQQCDAQRQQHQQYRRAGQQPKREGATYAGQQQQRQHLQQA